jgi:hypothetical protein
MYGPNMRAFVVYLMIELRLSNQKTVEHMSLLYDLPLAAPIAHYIKSEPWALSHRSRADNINPGRQGTSALMSSSPKSGST